MNAIQVKWIPSYSTPFSRGHRWEDDRFSLSFSPSDREAWSFESRVDRKPRAFLRPRTDVAVWLSRFADWNGAKGKFFLSFSTVFLIRVSQERSYGGALRKRQSRATSCSGNSERKYSSSPLCVLERLSSKHATNIQELSKRLPSAISTRECQ